MDLEEKGQRLLDRQVLEEVLGEDRRDAGEVEPLAQIGDHVHARKRVAVDVDPTLDPLVAAAEVEADRWLGSRSQVRHLFGGRVARNRRRVYARSSGPGGA